MSVRPVRRPTAPVRRAKLRELADEELMELVAARNAAAFEVVLDRHGGVAFSLAQRICGQPQLAEEAVQDAFLALWRQGARYDADLGTPRTFLLGIVRNRAIDLIRARTTRERRISPGEQIPEAKLASGKLTHDEAVRRDEARSIRGALAGLPDEQRQVIELAYFGGLTHTEIAQRLSLPPGTVKGRMRLGLARLRANLSELAPAERAL